MTTTVSPPVREIGEVRRWAMLAISTLAQAAAVIANNGAIYLLPTLHRSGYTLASAGTIVAAPSFGVMASLVAWGWLADHRGERVVLLSGLAATAVCSGVAALTHGVVALWLLLFLAGAASASANSASGRVVVGWFPPHRRGLAMGIRQMGQPVGMAVAAVAVSLVADHHGVHVALLIPTAACLLAAGAVAVVVLDPPRPERKHGSSPSPYRQSTYLARIHAVSVLLVVPQFVVSTFMLVWLEQSRGWSAGAASALVAVANVLGAFGRMGSGQLSDMVHSRMRPLQWVAVAAGITMLLLGATARLDGFLAVLLIVLAAVLSVADNGLAFTAVAERAGPFWSGRALGLQNTAQFLTSAFVPPLGGLAVTHLGFAWTYVVTGLFPLLAIGLVPVRGERATP